MNPSLLNFKLFFFAVGVLSFVFSLLINRLFLRFSTNLGVRNAGEGGIIRWNTTSKPALGGISFFIVFLLSVAACTVWGYIAGWSFNKQFFGILSACTLGFVMGLADDAYDTRPWLKFSVQLFCGLTLILCGISIHLFNSEFANYILTLMWVVGLMNSINMLDNMDAIAGITATFIIIAIITRVVMYQNVENIYLVMLLAVGAAIVGFLYYNWNPSKMFMGDTGSQFMGVFLAAFSTIYLWNDFDASIVPSSVLKKIIIPVLAFLLPICDTTTVVINRLLAHKSPFVGGRDHTTHHLAYWGYNEKQVALIFTGLSINSILLFWLIQKNTLMEGCIGQIVSIIYIGAVFFYLYIPTNKRLQKKAR